MTCSSKNAFTLNIHSEFESTDDDKTPEYPLSDDHPLSLHNRAKLSCKAMSKYEMETKSSSQSYTSLNQTNNVVNSSARDECENHDGHLAFASQQPRCMNSNEKRPSYFTCDILHRVTDEKQPKIFGQKYHRKRSSEALDLASEPVTGFTNPNVHLSNGNVSLHARSLIDFFVGNRGLTRPYQIGGYNVTNKLPSVLKTSKQSNRNQEYYSIFSTDSNNNSGPSSCHISKEKKELHQSIHKNDISNRSKRTAFHGTPPNYTSKDKMEVGISVIDNKQNNSNTDSYEFDIDVEDKNTPPQLSPVVDLSPKSEVTVNSQSPTFPPILSPLKGDSSCLSLSFEDSSVRDDSRESQKSKAFVQISPKIAIRTTSISPKVEPFTDDSTDTKENLSSNEENVNRTCGWNSSLNSPDALLKGNERKDTCKHYQGQPPKWKKYTGPKLSIQITNDRDPPDCLPRHGEDDDMQASSPSLALSCPDLVAEPANKYQDRNCSAQDDTLKKHLSSPKSGKTMTSKIKTIAKDDIKKGTQMFLSTEAKYVTSGESTLCYPYSTQKALDHRSSTTKESEPRLTSVQNGVNLVNDRMSQAKMPLRRKPPYPFIEKVSGSQNVSATCESSPVNRAELSTPTCSLTSPLLPLIAPSSLPIRDLPLLATPRLARSQFSPNRVTENCPPQATRDDIIMKPVTTTAEHVRVINFNVSSHNSVFLPEVSTHSSENTVIYNNGDEKRPRQESYYVFAEWSGPSTVAMNWARQENVLEFSDKFNTNGIRLVDSEKVQSAASGPTTGRERAQATEVANSAYEQDRCKTGVSSSRQVKDVPPSRDISFKSSPTLEHTAHQVLAIRENDNVRYDNVNRLNKFERECTNTLGPLYSSKGPPEPLDLSSKPLPLYSTSSSNRKEMIKSTAKILPYLRFRQPEYGKDNVLERKSDNPFADDMTHRKPKTALKEDLLHLNNIQQNNNTNSPSNLSSEIISSFEKSQQVDKMTESRLRSRPPSFLQQQETDDLSLPNEPNLVIDLEDIQMELSPLKGLQMQENRRTLPVDNYCSLNADEKSYSHLAYAAITSKRKKSLASCMMPSENEDFLAFLRGDASRPAWKGGNKFDATIFNSVQNGEVIDLTEDNEDVLSVSSDGTTENMTVLYEPENILSGRKGVSFPVDETFEMMPRPVTECFTGSIEDVHHGIRTADLLHHGTTESASSEMNMITDQQIDMESRHRKFPSDDATIKAGGGTSQPWPPDPSAVFDYSELSFMKSQSLAFSRPQRARMAKRIQDIISRNSKLLPDYMQQSSRDPFHTNVSNISKRPKSETGQSTQSFTESLHEYQNSRSYHLKVKRSLSLEDEPASFVQPPRTETVLRCSSVIDTHQNPPPPLASTSTDDETAQVRAPRSSPRNDHKNSEESSLYKTVWQTQFITDNPSNLVGNGKCNISEKSFPRSINSQDLVQRLELMHDASNSLNQASFTNRNKESTSGENWSPVRKRQRTSSTKMFSQLGSASDEISMHPLSHSLNLDSHSHIDNTHMPLSVSGQLNTFIPSTFVVAPFYAMAHPLCYPAFQGVTAPNQPILLSHHNDILDVVESRTCQTNGRKRTKMAKSQVCPRRKNVRRHNRNNNLLIDELECNEIVQSLPHAFLGTDVHPVNVTNITKDNVQDHLKAKIDETAIPNAQRYTDLQDSGSPGYHGNFQELLVPDYSSYVLQTRNEDGLTILSMQCAEEYKSNEINETVETRCSNQGGEFCKSIPYNFKSDCNFSTRIDSSAANSSELSVPDKAVSAQPVNVHNPIGQNLATLALASETHDRIRRPAYCQLGTSGKMSAGPISPRRKGDTRTSFSSLHSNLQVKETDISPENGITPQDETQMLHTASPGREEYHNSKQKPMSSEITEKEKLVTEMLAAMMQNRKLASGEKSSYWTHAASS